MPDNEIDPDIEEALWEIANEDRENRLPAEWWEDELSYTTLADQLRGSFERLVGSGCSAGELLQQMRHISALANSPVMPRRHVEAHLRKTRELSDELDVLPMTQVGPTLGDTSGLQRALVRHREKLESFLKRSRRNPHPDLAASVEEFRVDDDHQRIAVEKLGDSTGRFKELSELSSKSV